MNSLALRPSKSPPQSSLRSEDVRTAVSRPLHSLAAPRRGRRVSAWMGAFPERTTSASSSRSKSARNAECASETKAARRLEKAAPRRVRPPTLAPMRWDSTWARLSPWRASQMRRGAMWTFPRKKASYDVR